MYSQLHKLCLLYVCSGKKKPVGGVSLFGGADVLGIGKNNTSDALDVKV